MQIEQILENDALGDHSHVEDEGKDWLLRQAGTEVGQTSRIRRGHGRREGAGDAGWPVRLLWS